jgi:hypothetical protein
VAQPLVPPLDLSAFDFTPTPPYFATAFKTDLANIDAFDSDFLNIETTIGVVDLAAIALALDTPIGIADVALSDFERTDFTADTATVIAAAPLIDQGITNNETTAGNVGAAGSKIVIPSSPIAGVATGAGGGASAPAAPAIPSVGAGIKGPPLAGAQAFITNINRPGDPGHYKVGDPWQITIKAPAGSQIYAVASHNGVSLGQLAFGAVPTSGVLLFHGTFAADQLGSWIENWYAGTSFINQIVFQVG